MRIQLSVWRCTTAVTAARTPQIITTTAQREICLRVTRTNVEAPCDLPVRGHGEQDEDHGLGDHPREELLRPDRRGSAPGQRDEERRERHNQRPASPTMGADRDPCRLRLHVTTDGVRRAVVTGRDLNVASSTFP